MTAQGPAEITSLLKAWGTGDRAALERLTPLVYEQLCRIAHRYMEAENPGNTLQTTALVHEAYLRLVDVRSVDWHDRSHFFAIASQMMRRILVDAARAHATAKRGGDGGRVVPVTSLSLDQIPDLAAARSAELVALDEALDALAQWDARKARVIELRFFGGLSVEETAEVLHISPQSVKRDWSLARAWLMRELSR